MKQPKSLDIYGSDKLKWLLGKAWDARALIRSAVRSCKDDAGEHLVSYGYLMNELYVNRFDLAEILGTLVWIDTRVGESLWCSFVVYERDGTVGGNFFESAKKNGWEPGSTSAERGEFISQMRQACIEDLET